MTEEEIRKIFKDEFEKFYRRKYPTFQVTLKTLVFSST